MLAKIFGDEAPLPENDDGNNNNRAGPFFIENPFCGSSVWQSETMANDSFFEDPMDAGGNTLYSERTASKQRTIIWQQHQQRQQKQQSQQTSANIVWFILVHKELLAKLLVCFANCFMSCLATWFSNRNYTFIIQCLDLSFGFMKLVHKLGPCYKPLSIFILKY